MATEGHSLNEFPKNILSLSMTINSIFIFESSSFKEFIYSSMFSSRFWRLNEVSVRFFFDQHINTYFTDDLLGDETVHVVLE